MQVPHSLFPYLVQFEFKNSVPDHMADTNVSISEPTLWCGKHIGTESCNWVRISRWNFGYTKAIVYYYFANEQDAVFFKLTWVDYVNSHQ